MEEKNQRLTDQGFNPGTDPFNEKNRNESTTSSQLEEWLIGSINIPKIQLNISFMIGSMVGSLKMEQASCKEPLSRLVEIRRIQ